MAAQLREHAAKLGAELEVQHTVASRHESARAALAANVVLAAQQVAKALQTEATSEKQASGC